jgi:organic radical activating enzyme
MVFIVQQANNFCPAPWVGMYYHSNAASPCCTMDTFAISPNDYLKSNWLKTLKEEFLKGDKPSRCNSCWVKEQQGLKSIRNHMVKSFKFNDALTAETTKHLELRESNLCNFACRMCNPTDSVKLEREIEDHPELSNFYRPNLNTNMSEDNWKEILDVSLGLRSLYLTGGEPMLMKRYYDLLDHLIENGRNEDIDLRIYTNCSVYNPVFIEKLSKFKYVTLKLSIDAVGKVAEYQRYGTDWGTVKSNIFKFLELPVKIGIHSTITAYSILDMSSLADFFNEVNNYGNSKATLTKFNAHVARIPASLDYANLNIELRAKAISEIDVAVEKLSDDFFSIYVKELLALRKQLLERRDCNYQFFVNMTKTLDKIRNQSFEEVFGYKI